MALKERKKERKGTHRGVVRGPLARTRAPHQPERLVRDRPEAYLANASRHGVQEGLALSVHSIGALNSKKLQLRNKFGNHTWG